MGLPIIGLAVGLAGTAFNMAQQMSFQNKQENALNDWANWQRNKREEEYGRQDALRGQAQQHHEQGLEDLRLQAQTDRQAEEADRLEAFLLNGADNEATGTQTDIDAALLSQEGVGSELYQADRARAFAEASRDAQERIAALANAQAYGGSFGGLGTVNPIQQGRAQQGIGLQNNKRQGSLSAYQNERAVDPVRYNPPQSLPVGQLAGIFMG